MRINSIPTSGGFAMTLLALLALTLPVLAQERKLDAGEIERMLSGNTVDGNWRGTPFSQYFADGGLTLYAAKGTVPTEGKWRVDPATNQYCSWWRGGQWDCYDIFSDGPDSVIWVVPKDGYRSPSTLHKGKKL